MTKDLDRFYCTVTGSSPSYCDAVLRLNADRDSRFAYFDIDDVTGDDGADFIVNRPMAQYESSNTENAFTLIKR